MMDKVARRKRNCASQRVKIRVVQEEKGFWGVCAYLGGELGGK